MMNEINERLGREVNLSAVHVTLYRLEDKGLVKSRMGGAIQTRGGKAQTDLFGDQCGAGHAKGFQ